MPKPGRHWHYLAVEHDDEDATWVGIHEVYIDEAGKVHRWSEGMMPPIADDRADLESMLTMMQRDIRRFGVVKKADLVVGLELVEASE